MAKLIDAGWRLVIIAYAFFLAESADSCDCSQGLIELHDRELFPLRADWVTARPNASNACAAAERLLGRGLGVQLGGAALVDCPQLLLPAASACAESAAEASSSGDHEVDFWVRLAGWLLRLAKDRCIGQWVMSGLPSISAAEVQFNVQQYTIAIGSGEAFRWQRWSVPTFTATDFSYSWIPRLSFAEAARKWAYDGAEVGEACRGGDLECGDGHCYAPALDRVLASWVPSRHTAAKMVDVRYLELGVCAGHSMATWQDYLDGRFGASKIVGVDLNLTIFNQHVTTLQNRGLRLDSIHPVEGNLSTLGTGRALDADLSAFAPFDIIIDDASHMDSDIESVFLKLFYNEALGLAPGGLYIVLDIQGSYRPGGSQLALFKSLVDAAQWSGTTVVSAEQLSLFVAHSGSKEEAWVEAVEFHRGFVVVRKRPASR